jgi:CDP-glucose 4,6-dehydratase
MENLFDGIYKGKKVLVTGHTGFKGSWLALWLTKLGAEVVGYSKDIPTNPSHFELLNLKINSIEGDILDKDKIYKTIEEERPDIIFHLAAQALVRKSYKIPVETFETNIIGSINIFEACRKLGFVKAIVNITSDKCYRNQEREESYEENDPLGGDDPYSASKGCAEIVAQSYRTSFFHIEKFGINHSTLLANVRAGNVIGGGDWAEDRLLPDIVKATHLGEKAIIRNPNSTRPWQHVLEPISGYLKVGQNLLEGKKEHADNWNFGPSDESALKVSDVVKEVKTCWDKVHYEILEDTTNFHEASMLKLNSQKAKEYLNWQSVWGAKKTIEKTVNWYKTYYEQGVVLSEKDLEEYTQDLKI